MGLPTKLSHLPARVTAGALILNSGLDISKLPEEAAAGMQEMGAKGLPPVKKLSARSFRKLLSRGEVGLGAALIAPVVPSWIAGLGLASFSGTLLAMYFRTPEFTKKDGVRPTEAGTPIAKDIVLFGTGVTLVLDDLCSRKKK